MQLVDNNTFLQRLAALFESSNTKGSSVWLTHKRLTYADGEDAAMAVPQGEADDREYPCLLRVTDGGEVKFSTHVAPGDLARFQSAYGTLLKNSMSKLRKRDKKREKERTDRITLRKKNLAEDVVVQGPKRGNGRRKRQRLMKAAERQEGLRKKAEEREKRGQQGSS